jgi:tetratricopeptide (TPR) repeat protein
VYEAAPVALLPKSAGIPKPTFNPSQSEAVLGRGRLDGQLPQHPDTGFLGRDETLLALDRAFDTQSIVVLQAYAGSGKTSTVAEFGRWYALTGGVEGLVLFTSFERYMPLARLLDKIGQVFGDALEAAGVHWLALSDEERRDIALQLLRQVSVLWIWDNVEPVAGFPAGTESAWSSAEQEELVDFLRDAQQTQAKFLLTSRRNEQGWLGNLPHRITVPPMPMRERVQLARAVAEKYGHQLTQVEDWRPLLRYSQGNPMTITAVVGQALRNEFRTREQIEEFVFQLRSGEAKIDDDQSEGRSKSLGASLSYGFEHAFTEEERQQLALLYFFQGFVNVGALCLMGLPEAEWCVPTVRGLTFEAGIALLDRAAEVGLLTRVVENCYRIHPVLPWYFKKLFDQYYLPDEGNNPTLASRAYVEAIGVLANYSNNQYDDGNRDLVILLNLEEANLLYARQLAQTNGWWLALMKTVQGLRTLYEHTGRRLEWARLVEEIIPHFVDPATDGSLPGREEEWALLTEYRVELAREGQQWTEAERLHRARMEWARQQASSALAAPLEALDSTQRKTIRTLSGLFHELGQILREQGRSECVAAYEKAFTLLKRIGEKAGAAVCALNLGHAYTQIPTIRNLEKAEQWYQRSLELRDRQDRLGRSKCLTELGRVAHERFQQAQTTREPEEELRQHLNEALHCSAQALNLLPQNAVKDLAVAHNQIGNICRSAGDLDRAFLNYRETIRYEEAQGNLYGAANTRFNIALVLAQASRFDEALLYAQAALCNFKTFGDRAAADIQDTEQLIRLIEQSLKPREG